MQDASGQRGQLLLEPEPANARGRAESPKARGDGKKRLIPPIPASPRAAFRFCDDDPIRIIYTPEAQYVICLGCGVIAGPRELLPMPHFVLAGKEFLREHRFHAPKSPWPPKLRAPLGPTHAFPARHAAPWEQREPGAEG